jgi:phosphoenolpyruvate synthase/pyruvate phosphate dikinase
MLWYTLCDELITGTVGESELRQRMRQAVFFWGAHGTEMSSGEEGDRMADAIREVLYKKTEQDEIKGVCVSRGKASGRAVVVMHPDEFQKVQAGDILFTMMTRPEFLPVMQLAAAFVTDEGGITSHAAIVAREMKKPCIVATKTGTKTVKDGDLVEVDANEGIVRILERADDKQ